MTTLQELLEQRAALDRQISETQRASRTQAIIEIRELMVLHGLTPTDLASVPVAARKPKQGVRGKVAAKYRNDETGQTWTGRGLKPRWLTEKLKSGAALPDFAI